MVERTPRTKFLYEGAAARYRALMVKTSDPARRRMLEEMIARELETIRHRSLIVAPRDRARLASRGGAEPA